MRSGLDLYVPPGAFATLLGPSGSGKTTTLRCIAGLERPDGGEIAIGSQIVSDERGIFVSPQKRGLGMVFQSFAVWPHMTVADNVGYPLKIQHWRITGREQSDIDRTVIETLDLVGLTEYRDRYPSQLSGGQQQRVALARALVGNPSLVLFDEPLSNLDAQLREQMRFELRSLHERIGMTALYVTHDQAEAMELSDIVFLMDEGRIVQSGPPFEVYERPDSVFSCKLMGPANIFEIATIDANSDSGTVRVSLKEGFSLTARPARDNVRQSTHVAVRPHRFILSADSGVDANSRCHIDDIAYLGERVRYTLSIGTTTIRVDAFVGGRRLKKSDIVSISVDPGDVILI